MRGVLRRTILLLLGLLILGGELKRTADLLDETREFFRRLGGDSLDISLENKEILGFDENVVLREGFVVRSIGDGSFIQLVLGSARC